MLYLLIINELYQKLLGTKSDLVEWNSWGDKTWGITDNDNKGNNALGKIIMEYRDSQVATEKPIQSENNIDLKFVKNIYENSSELKSIGSLEDYNNYINQVVANYKGELYNLPFNMNTFYQMWGVKTPEEAAAKIEEQKEKAGISGIPKNLEEQAIS